MFVAFSLLGLPLVAAIASAENEAGPECPDNDNDGDSSCVGAQASVSTTPGGGGVVTTSVSAGPGSSSSSSSGSSASLTQSIDIPTQNVLAVLALENGGFGLGFGSGLGGDILGDIANIHRTVSTNAFANNGVSLDPSDALLIAALRGNGFGAFGLDNGFGTFGLGSGFNTFGLNGGFNTFGLDNGFGPFGFGNGFGTSGLGGLSLTQCLRERALLDASGLHTFNSSTC